MKNLKVIFLFLACVVLNLSAHGQAKSARDFWFVAPLNNDPLDVAQKQLTLYVQPKSAGAVNVQVGNETPLIKLLLPGELWVIDLPKSIEMISSTTVEPERSVHVWCDESDLSVYFLSLSPNSTDGFQVIPSSYWGTQYIVASYSSLLINQQSDLPSEFCIVAAEDNTVISITPTQNIRTSADATAIGHPKNVLFTVTLQKGESIQYKAVFDIGGSEIDLTGTIITSEKPVGVIGASACPFIPADPYCDHISEMLLPITRWGSKYFTLPFGDRSGGDSYRVIGTRDGQTIFRNGKHYAVLNNFESYFRDGIDDASEWTSAHPFLLVKYMNGRTYGGASNPGDPAMVHINPSEHARQSVSVLVPTISPGAGHSSFTDYIHVFVPTAAATSLLYDGNPLLSSGNVTRIPFGSMGYEGIRMKNVAEGMHLITCDSPITAYVYGYTNNDSYAWTADLGGDGHEIWASVDRTYESLQSIRIWPSPARTTDILRVAITDESITAVVTMIDILGKQVLEATYRDGVSLSSLTPGIYTVIVTQGSKTYSATLVLTQ